MNGRAVHSFLPVSTSRNRYSGSSSFIRDPSNDEEQPFDARGGDISVSHSQHGISIPKSRTFSVFSNLTQSFSLGSVTSLGAGSRNVSCESHISQIDPVYHPVYQQYSRPQSEDNHAAFPVLTTSSPLPTAPTSNIKEITTAMPPQYWAGRFMALHDRLHNELLEPHNLARVCETQATTHCPATANSTSQAAAQNNPSKPIYATPRPAHTSKYAHTRVSHNQRYNHPSRIPQSATSGAIVQSSAYNIHHTPSYIPPYHSWTVPGANENTIPEYPVYTIPKPNSNNNDHSHPTTLYLTAQSLNHPTQNTTFPAPTTGETHPKEHDEAERQDEEQTRAHRVLSVLASYCTTPAALASLYAWQTEWVMRENRKIMKQQNLLGCNGGGRRGGAAAGIGGEGSISHPLPINVLVAAATAGPAVHHAQHPHGGDHRYPHEGAHQQPHEAHSRHPHEPAHPHPHKVNHHPTEGNLTLPIWSPEQKLPFCTTTDEIFITETPSPHPNPLDEKAAHPQQQQQQQRAHEFGRRGKEMVRRLRRGLAGRGVVDDGQEKGGGARKGEEGGAGLGGRQEGKEKGGRKRFSFF